MLSRDDEEAAAVGAPSLAFRDGRFVEWERRVPDEVAVAISIGGSTHAVMMASPRDIEEMGVGLALNEAIVANVREIDRIEVAASEYGLDCRLWLTEERAATYVGRRRLMAGPVGCGLCGVESLELAVRPVARVEHSLVVAPQAIFDAMSSMARGQALGRATRAVHAAGFFVTGEGLVVLREDVGRHNALDKVAGYLALAGRSASQGFIVITSRVSVELIQKAAAMGCGLIAAVSAPTALAIATAEASGIALVAVVRGDEFEIFSHAERIVGASQTIAADNGLPVPRSRKESSHAAA